MPKITEEKINKRKALYLKHKSFIDDFYKFFKGSFVQKQGREIVIKLDYKYNSFDKKTNKIIEKPYTVNIFNKAIKELEELGLVKSKKYYDTNNKSISYTKPLLCLILNVDNQTNFASPSYSRTTNRIYDTNLFKGKFILRVCQKVNNTMFMNNQELLEVYYGLYQSYLKINNLKEDKSSNQYINYIEFYNRTEQIKNLKSNPTKKEKTNYDTIKKLNKYNYCNFETLIKRNIYLCNFNKSKNNGIITVRFIMFCFENMNAEKLTQFIGDTIQTSIEMFDGIGQIDFEIECYTLNYDYGITLKTSFDNDLYYDTTINRRINYRKSIFNHFNNRVNNIKIKFTNANIINDYREGNQREAFENITKTNRENKIKALENKKES